MANFSAFADRLPDPNYKIREQGDRSYLNLSKDEHIVRLHIGLEDPKDLIEDLRRSLKFIK